MRCSSMTSKQRPSFCFRLNATKTKHKHPSASISSPLNKKGIPQQEGPLRQTLRARSVCIRHGARQNVIGKVPLAKLGVRSALIKRRHERIVGHPLSKRTNQTKDLHGRHLIQHDSFLPRLLAARLCLPCRQRRQIWRRHAPYARGCKKNRPVFERWTVKQAYSGAVKSINAQESGEIVG